MSVNQPTALKGTIQNEQGESIIMATIRLEGATEKTFSDDRGNYLLTALEATSVSAVSQRLVTVTASGYAAITQSISLPSGSTQTLNFTIKR